MIKYFFIIFVFILSGCSEDISYPIDREFEKVYPSLFRDIEKQFPNTDLGLEAYIQGKQAVNTDMQTLSRSFTGFDKDWTIQGPGNIGARINSLAFDPNNNNIIFAGFSGGGLWRTKDGGETWKDVFNGEVFNSIAHITINPKNSQEIYIGTGDPNVPGRAYIGEGIFKSIDGGDSWSYLGLEEQRIISKVRIHPNNDDILFAGSMGLPYSKNNTRGLYKSSNRGTTWDRVLAVSDSTGISDIVINPEQPDIILAATWDRVRSYNINIVSGFGSGIFRSTDGGENWNRAQGIPDTALCRTGLTICKNNPQYVYAITVSTERQLSAIYKSDDYGASFEQLPIQELIDLEPLRGFGWYFGKIEVNPNDPNHIFVLGVDLWESKDNGLSWSAAAPPWFTYEVHADKHDLDISDDGYLYLATDGGMYKRKIEEEVWEDIENIPTTQFYRVAYNPHRPDEYFGGAQDNGTTGGNESFINDWPRIFGGDGFQPIFNPFDENHFFVETQRGGIRYTIDGGEEFNDATSGLEGDRNWDMPYIMSSLSPRVMYTGTNQVFRLDDSYEPEWYPISDNLTAAGDSSFIDATITAIDESSLDPRKLYVGTSNGLIWKTTNGGNDWEMISNDLPIRYVTSVKASPSSIKTVYATLSGYKNNEFIPRIYKSDDEGSTWTALSNGIPDVAINDILVIPGYSDQFIFAATDGGIYGSCDSGATWERLGTNMPNIVCYDLDYNVENQELVVGTFGRSIMSYPINEILEPLSLDDLNLDDKLVISPNPVGNFMDIMSDNNTFSSLEILDMQGKTLLNLQDWNSNNRIDISKFKAGQYIIIGKHEQKIYTKAFIKI